MGLSLVELAMGRYPIPGPKSEDLEEIFSVPPDGPPNPGPSVVVPGARSPPGGAASGAAETKLAIFELLDYIVNEVKTCLMVSGF